MRISSVGCNLRLIDLFYTFYGLWPLALPTGALTKLLRNSAKEFGSTLRISLKLSFLTFGLTSSEIGIAVGVGEMPATSD